MLFAIIELKNRSEAGTVATAFFFFYNKMRFIDEYSIFIERVLGTAHVVAAVIFCATSNAAWLDYSLVNMLNLSWILEFRSHLGILVMIMTSVFRLEMNKFGENTFSYFALLFGSIFLIYWVGRGPMEGSTFIQEYFKTLFESYGLDLNSIYKCIVRLGYWEEMAILKFITND